MGTDDAYNEKHKGPRERKDKYKSIWMGLQIYFKDILQIVLQKDIFYINHIKNTYVQLQIV